MNKRTIFNTAYPITKMQGCGNDFVVYVDFEEKTKPNDVKRICDRHFGVGADGVITVTKSRIQEAQYRMKYFNADGSFAQMCGNGIRCFTKYLLDNNLIKKKGKIFVDTDAGIIIPEILKNNFREAIVRVAMGQPIFYNPNQITLRPDKDGLVHVPFEHLWGIYVNVGNPHLIFFVKKGEAEQYAKKHGSEIEQMTTIFPQKINVGFVEVQNKRNFTVHVWERGSGLTLACGTNACAAFVAAVKQGFADNQGKIFLPGGKLELSWAGDGSSVFMTGPAANVFAIQKGDVFSS